MIIADDAILRGELSVTMCGCTHPSQSATLDTDVLPVDIPLPPNLVTDTAAGALPRVAMDMVATEIRFEIVFRTLREVELRCAITAGNTQTSLPLILHAP